MLQNKHNASLRVHAMMLKFLESSVFKTMKPAIYMDEDAPEPCSLLLFFSLCQIFLSLFQNKSDMY